MVYRVPNVLRSSAAASLLLALTLNATASGQVPAELPVTDARLARATARATAALEAGHVRRARRWVFRALTRQANAETFRLAESLLIDGESAEDAGAVVEACDTLRAPVAGSGRALARAHMLLGDLETAFRGMAQAAEAQNAQDLQLLRELALRYAEREELAPAQRCLELARRVMPQDVGVLFDLAALLVARGLPLRAIPLLQSRLQLRPGDMEARRRLALAFHAAGRTDEAIGEFLGLGGPASLTSAARAALESGDPRRGRALALRAVRASSGDPSASVQAGAHRALGLCLAALQEPEGAVRALRRALVFEPESSETLGALRGLEPGE